MCALALAYFFEVMGGVRVEPRPLSLVVLTSLGTAVIASVAVFVGLARGQWLLGQPRSILLAMIVLLPLAFLAWKVAITAPYPDMSVSWPTRPGWRCFRLSFLFAGPPFMALLWLFKSTDPVHPRAMGAALGASAGACAAVVVDLWCPVAYVPHLLLGHLLPMVALTALGTLVGDRIVGIRARSKRRSSRPPRPSNNF